MVLLMGFDFDEAMPFARNTLYSRLRKESGEEWHAYVTHRFVRGLADGTLPHDEYVAWMVQDYLYLIHYTRAYALLVYKSETVAQMRRAAGIVSGLLNSEMALHRQQLEAAGISEDALGQAQECIETLAYGRYLLDRAQTGDVLDLVVTMSPCLAGYGEIGLRLLGDPDTVRSNNPYLAWIETYGGGEYQALVQEGLAHMEELSRDYGGLARYPMLLRQFRQSVRLETAFWDAGIKRKDVLF
jgi:thiaminase/transcriptional activator TenA